MVVHAQAIEILDHGKQIRRLILRLSRKGLTNLCCNAFLIDIILLGRRTSVPIQLSEALCCQRDRFLIPSLYL